MMKYNGTIIGLRSSVGSVYNIITDDKKCTIWKANVEAEIKDKSLQINFKWNGEPYELKLSLLNENYYTGKIIYDNENNGEVFLWSFSNATGLLLKGDYIESDSGAFNCFIELRPL